MTSSVEIYLHNAILKSSIRLAKKTYYLKQFNTCKNDSRKTWKTINDLISNRKEKTSPTYFNSLISKM